MTKCDCCLVEVRPGSGYYEVCLAVIETSTVYYLHQSLCTEVEVVREEQEEEEVVEVVVRPGVETARVDWAGVTTETVRLTVRQWGQPVPVISRLSANSSSLVSSLQSDTAYTVCLEPAQWRTGATKHCQEVSSPVQSNYSQISPHLILLSSRLSPRPGSPGRRPWPPRLPCRAPARWSSSSCCGAAATGGRRGPGTRRTAGGWTSTRTSRVPSNTRPGVV